MKAPAVSSAGAGDTGVDRGIDGGQSITHCPIEIAQRRASSLRFQAIGQIGGA